MKRDFTNAFLKMDEIIILYRKHPGDNGVAGFILSSPFTIDKK
jgi:hypothetical protein